MIDSAIILPDDFGPERGAAQGEAVLLRRDGTVGRGNLARLRGQLSGDYATILPGQLVRGLLTDMPQKARPAERLSIARFAHEDGMATDPDAQHVVVGAGQPAPTAIVAPAVIEALLQDFDPDVVLSDFDALSSFGATPQRLLGRVVVPGPAGHTVDADWAEGAVARPDDAALARAVFARLDSGDALDLRSGVFRRQRRLQAGPWGKVAAAAVLCAALGLGFAGVDARATQAQADTLEAEARALYQASTGDAAPARLSALARTAGSTDASAMQFLDLSQVLFDAVASVPGTRVDGLSYDSREGLLRLRIDYPGFDAAAQLEEAVAVQGGQLTTGGVREQDGGFIGDASLVLAGGGAG